MCICFLSCEQSHPQKNIDKKECKGKIKKEDVSVARIRNYGKQRKQVEVRSDILAVPRKLGI